MSAFTKLCSAELRGYMRCDFPERRNVDARKTSLVRVNLVICSDGRFATHLRVRVQCETYCEGV